MRYPYAPIRLIRTAIFGLALLCPNISQAQDFTSGLVGHWELDETSGTTATDSSPSGNDGAMTAMDGASDSVTGQIGSTLSFTSSSRITAGAAATNIDDIFAGGGTISYWIYPTSWGVFGRVLDKSDAGGYPPNSGWHQQGTGTRAIFSHAFSGGTGQWELASGSAPLNTWSHLSVTYDSSDPNNDPTFYINGTPVALFADNNATGTAISDAANPITFGSRQGGGNNYTGYIDDARMYNRILSAADITALYAYTGVNYTCSSPDGVTGEMLFNNDARALQYCNASSWVGIGPADSLENGLVGHWKLDETSGSGIADSSGNGNDGTWTDSTGNDVAEETVSGQVGTALSFDGSNDYISIAPYTDTDSFTVSLWVNPQYTTDNAIFVTNVESSNPWSGWSLMMDRPLGSCAIGDVCMWMHSDGTGGDWIDFAYDFPTNTWTHFAATYSTVTGYLTFYANGVKIFEELTAVTPDTSSANTAFIGRGAPGWSPGDHFLDGSMDDVRIYNRALSAGEIANIYGQPSSCTATTANLAGHWTLNETSGSSIADASGNGNTGTWNDGTGNDVTEETIAGQDGTAIDFDGAGDRVSIGSNASIENVFNGGGALSMWIYPEGWGGCSYGRILEKAAGITGSGGWSIIVNNGGGVNPKENIAFYKGHSTTYSRWTTPFQSITLNAWNHIAVSYSDDDLNNNPTIYINGTAQSLTQNNPPVGTPDSDVGTTMRIGYGGGCGFDGIIDDVRVYNGPLSATEVSSLYGATGGMCSVSTCAAPSGTTGEIVFNTDYDVMQYCNGSNWIAMGPPGNGGAGCTNPTGLVAELRYNTDLNVVQYCEGDEWIAVIGTSNASIPTAGLVGYWKLDETSGTTAVDSSGLGYDATMGGGLDAGVNSVAGQNGTALIFDGSNDYAIVNGASPALQITGSLTVATWVKGDTLGTLEHLVSKQGNNPNYGWRLASTGSNFRMGITADGINMVERRSTLNPSTDVWYHVVSVYDANAQTLDMYINGILDNGTLSGTIPAIQHNSTVSVNIGRRSAGNRPFDGTLDEVRIYNRALSSAEILSLYNATK